MKKRLVGISLIILVCISLINTPPVVSAQSAELPVELIRSIELGRAGIYSPTGFTFDFNENSFIVFERSAGTTGTGDLISLKEVKLFEREASGIRTLNTLSNSIGQFMYDTETQTAYFYDGKTHRIFRIQSQKGGWLAPQSVNIERIGAAAITGLTIDPTTNALRILDASHSQIVQLAADQFADSPKEPVLSRKTVSGVNLNKVKGVTINPVTNRIFLVTSKPDLLIELSATGQVSRLWSLASLGIHNAAGLVFAPTGDPTDDPEKLAVNILDAGTADNSASGNGSRILEVSLEISAVEPLAETFPVQIVNSVRLSTWNPPSPDAAGIAYWPATGGLLISDSEVDQLPNLFTGKNVYISTLNGVLTGTCTTLPFSYEPTGVAINPANGHIFFSNDDSGRVHEVNLGPDHLYCTADDSYTSISTRLFNSYDPEGVAYGDGKLLIADGTGREVYIVSPGVNGIFDGISPTGDDTVTNFDTSIYNMNDPEGIEYNPERGTINLVGNYAVKAIVETDFSGNLIANYDLTSLPTSIRSGLAYGPASNGSGQKHFYLVSRGVDDGTDPNENDGMLYEIDTFQTIPSSTPSPIVTSTNTLTPTRTLTATRTSTPTQTATTDLTRTFTPTLTHTLTPTLTLSPTSTLTQTATPLPNSAPLVDAGANTWTILPGAAILDGTVSDDGRPDPPKIITTTWSKISGPGVVTFGDASVVDTTASFSQVGTYVLQLSASDGSLTSTDTVTVVVMASGVNSVFEKRIAAGNDDAEESSSGTMNLTHSTLELVTDTTVQTVGFYFSGLNIPPGAKITNAYMQFKTAKKTTTATSLVIRAQASANPVSFTTTARNISSRIRSVASVSWSPAAWNVVGEAGVNQRTTNLSAVVQEIVNQPGWAIGNPAVFIFTGSGKRVARSYNGDVNGAALLHVEFQPSGILPTATSTSTYTSTPSQTPTPTNTSTKTPSATPSVTATATNTLTSTPSQTSTPTYTPTGTSTVSETPTMTATSTQTLESSFTPTLTSTPTASPTTMDTTNFSFVSMADAQAQTENFSLTVNQISTLDPDLVLFNGDLETNGVVTEELDPMVNAIKGSGLFNRTFLVRGNHDDNLEGSAELWETYFETEPNIKVLPAGVTDYVSMNSNSDTMNYGFVFGNSMFVGLDIPGGVAEISSAQLTFLDERLTYAEGLGLTHAFIFWHGPMYCVESTHCTCIEKTDASCTPVDLVNVINKHPIVSAFFHGHEHILGWVHMDDARVEGLTGNFEEFITSPAGGWTYNDFLYPERMDYFYPDMDSAQGFAAVTVDGDAFTFEIYKVGINTPVWTKSFTKSLEQPTATQSPTVIITDTPTITVTPTFTLIPSATFTLHPSETPTFTLSPTNTATITPTFIATFTHTPTTIANNTPPRVSAGQDQSVILPNSASLDGTVSDDGLPVPPGTMTILWSQVSGPGTVTFGNASAVDTSAQFSQAGTYVLSLSAYDGELTSVDQITILVGQMNTYEVKIVDRYDEAEEFANGWIYMTSTDLELVYDSSLQTVGLRFRSLPIPQGASVTNAYIQFTTDSASSEVTSLNIKAQATDNAGAFTSTTYNVSTRNTGTAVTTWQPSPWLAAGETGLNQRTPDLSGVITEVVNRSGWLPGNSMVFIITGSGRRVAVSYYGNANAAPLLHIEYISYQ